LNRDAARARAPTGGFAPDQAVPLLHNALPPDLMSAAERLDELAEILAAGLIRLRQRQFLNAHSRLEKNSLDFSPHRSVHETVRQRRKVQR
jgi:hypothetical protein